MLLRITAKTLRESSLKFKKKKIDEILQTIFDIFLGASVRSHVVFFWKSSGSQLKTHDVLKYRE